MTTIPIPIDLDREIVRRVGPLLNGGGVAPRGTRCRHERHGVDLDVHLTVPNAVDERIRQALVVRVLDALSASGERFGDIDVHIDADG